MARNNVATGSDYIAMGEKQISKKMKNVEKCIISRINIYILNA